MALSTVFVGMDTKNAVKIYRRDRRNHASPNSAQTEAAMAGALDVQLAGNAYYFGKLYENRRSGIRSARLKSRIFQERINCFMQPVLWEQFYFSG